MIPSTTLPAVLAQLPSEDCVLWPGSDRRGYGRLSVNNRTTAAHRHIYELLVGPIPPGLQIDHLCRQKMCVNPTHLEPVTHDENQARRRAAVAAAGVDTRTHCIHGHERNEINTYMWGTHQCCRPCNRRNAAAYKERKRAVA